MASTLLGYRANPTRYAWVDLPEDLRCEIQSHTGEVREEYPAFVDGEYAATLVTADMTVVVRAVPTHQLERVARLRRAIRAARSLPWGAPRQLWTLERLDWVAAGYEHVRGQVPSYAPGSPDIWMVVDLLAKVSTHAPCKTDQFESFAGRWNRLLPWHSLASTAQRVMTEWDRNHIDEIRDEERFLVEVLSAGFSVMNTNPVAANVLIGESGARLCDWTQAARGPAWLDAALLAVELVAVGHRPEHAETWVAKVPAWREASRAALDAFALGVLGAWMLASERPQRVNAARSYAAYRLRGRRR